jgi:predicted CXXCH cytochrome family protein
MTCHDGSVADSRFPSPGCHSIDVDYESARRAGRTLRPLRKTPREIVLVGGTTVSCTSCHDPASTRPHHMALPLARNALCLGCHPREEP